MSIHRIGIPEVVQRCTWCGVGLAPHRQVMIAGGRFADWSVRLETLRGHVVHVEVRDRAHVVTAVVPLVDTPAYHAGYDLLFVLCSAACRDALDAAIGGGEMIVTVADAPLRSAG